MVQHNAALKKTGAFKGNLHHKIIKNLDWNLLEIEDRLENFFRKIIFGLLPSYLKDYLVPCDNLRT